MALFSAGIRTGIIEPGPGSPAAAAGRPSPVTAPGFRSFYGEWQARPSRGPYSSLHAWHPPLGPSARERLPWGEGGDFGLFGVHATSSHGNGTGNIFRPGICSLFDKTSAACGRQQEGNRGRPSACPRSFLKKRPDSSRCPGSLPGSCRRVWASGQHGIGPARFLPGLLGACPGSVGARMSLRVEGACFPAYRKCHHSPRQVASLLAFRVRRG
jgi:hypothetical protein